jgi:NAD(P)H-hydrate epimerase
MKPLNRAESRDVDRRAIEELKVPGIVLMENAGRGAAEVLLSRESTIRTALILCGKGNNGGDGFVIARHLAIRGVLVQIALLAPPAEFAGDARTNYEIVERMQLPLNVVTDVANVKAQLDLLANGIDWIVDAMLGTGATGQPREPYRTAIAWANEQPARKLAVDLPSGLDCNTGQPAATTLRADITCTFHAPKIGFLEPGAAEFLGELHVISIGIPAVTREQS